MKVLIMQAQTDSFPSSFYFFYRLWQKRLLLCVQFNRTQGHPLKKSPFPFSRLGFPSKASRWGWTVSGKKNLTEWLTKSWIYQTYRKILNAQPRINNSSRRTQMTFAEWCKRSIEIDAIQSEVLAPEVLGSTKRMNKSWSELWS